MLKELYQEVRGIVYKCRKEYYLHLWELSDWEQEGLLCLHELISHEEELVEDVVRLRKYYKTTYRNRILDYIRKQESQKRKLDRQPYEEVSEIGHRLKSKELFLDELVAFREAIGNYKMTLDDVGLDNYQRLMSNERFKGRRAMLKDLKNHLKDFQDNTIL